jgi:hypothetical protein
VIDFDRTTDFQLPQRLLFDWSEDALAEAFAERQDGRFLFIASQRQWYRRSHSETGEPQWRPDEALEIECAIRAFLRETASALSPRLSGIRIRLGSAATMEGVKRLAESAFAGEVWELEPGELARQEAFGAALRVEFRRRPAAPAVALAPRPAASPAAPLGEPTAPQVARPTYPAAPVMTEDELIAQIDDALKRP